METIIYQEDINWLNNLLTAENHEQCQDAKVYFSETIKKMSRASQVVIKAFEDEQKSHNETKKNYEQTIETLKEKDCLIISLQEGIATAEAKVLAAEKRANDYKQMFLEEQTAHHEVRRSYKETVNTLIETDDCLKVSLKELEKEKASHAETRETQQNMILTIQAQHDAIRLQTIKAAQEMGRQFEQKIRQLEENLEQKDVLYQSLDNKYRAELSESRQQVEHLHRELEKEAKVLAAEKRANDYKQMFLEEQTAHHEVRRSYKETVNTLIETDDCLKVSLKELEKEKASHAETRETQQNIILTIQAQHDAIRLQTIKAAQEMGRQFEQKIRQLEENLEQKDVLYQSLDDRYRAELSDVKQLMENLNQELEEEKQIRKEREDIIFTIQAEKEDLCSQMQQQTSDLNKLYDETTRNFMRQLEEKDVLYQSLEQKCETQLSERHQLIESLKHELDTKRQQHFDALQEIQAQRDATRLQTIKAVQELGWQFEQKIRQLEENLEQKDVLYQSLDDKYRAELSESRQQVEHLHQELEKEAKARKENEEMIRIVQDEKVELYNQMEDKARAIERQFETEKMNFMKDLEQKDVLYQDLEQNYKSELSESRRQVENLQRELKKERKLCKEKEEMIWIVQDEKVELYNQMEDKARAMERQFETEKRNFMKDLEEREASCQDLEKKYKTEVFNSKRQIESLQQEMEKEREEAAQTILTIQSEKEALRVQMEQQLDVEKSKLQEELNKGEGLYRDLRKKYMELFFVAAHSC
ncbi:golgin subfamily A member 6-like protein 22 [Nothobranchius furzeri]|uniref:golgin subfamily A member 6-like protein 22 n=1 Tax=Nothobranchius furzeri TaxID=105023 RepID=UPI003904757B